MIEGLHAVIIALLGVVGGLMQVIRRRLDQLEAKIDTIIEEHRP